ncbi:MAG TPA: adenylyltransferase/cytidyltransferase family protein [Patescibacteria group bacterium]|nr:adenylyltransferase/cytidyltransferase family protein [Patescibacteria group bacterium]
MKTVLVGGCFDLLHYGHINFLEEAKKLGDHLVVALESDENVRRMKGDARPIHTQKQRKAMLEALTVVDEVISLPSLKTDAEYEALVKNVHPSIIAITQGDPMERKKRSHASLIGAEVVVIPKIHTPSTSQLSKLLGLE